MKARNLREWSLIEAAHLLNRAGFGGTPDEVRALHALGPEKAVDRLIAGVSVDKDPLPPPDWASEDAYKEQVREFMNMRRDTMAETGGPGGEGKEAEARKAGEARMKIQKLLRQNGLVQGVELTRWWMQRMLRGPHPLQEKMVLFWHGHFASSMEKVRVAYFMYRQNALFRELALGSFGELTKRIVRDPAMMTYLDIQQSRKQMPNENFAREVMELFALGEGHYSEDDIRAAARAFTGLRLDRASGRTSFSAYQHDGGEKTIFGRTGKFEPDDVVDLLLAQEACAPFLARKLLRFFVNDAPSDAEVAAFADVMRREDFHLGRSLRTLFLAEEFYGRKNIRAQIKSPIVFLIGLARQLELSDLPAMAVAGGMRDMGQVLFLPPNVAGWPGGPAWITTNTLFARYNLAGALARSGDPDFALYGGTNDAKLKAKPLAAKMAREVRGRVRRDWPKPDYARMVPADLRRDPAALVDALVLRLFQNPLRSEDRKAFLDFAAKEGEGGLTDLEVGRLVHLMMSTPLYQLT
jgi:uncharacterized protein (DUF1800 family)